MPETTINEVLRRREERIEQALHTARDLIVRAKVIPIADLGTSPLLAEVVRQLLGQLR